MWMRFMECPTPKNQNCGSRQNLWIGTSRTLLMPLIIWFSRVYKRVAAHLGNTPAICKTNYVDPELVRAICEGEDR